MCNLLLYNSYCYTRVDLSICVILTLLTFNPALSRDSMSFYYYRLATRNTFFAKIGIDKSNACALIEDSELF